MKNDCEVMTAGKCLGCVGLAEKDWIGKYNCKEFKKWRYSKDEQIQKYKNRN